MRVGGVDEHLAIRFLSHDPFEMVYSGVLDCAIYADVRSTWTTGHHSNAQRSYARACIFLPQKQAGLQQAVAVAVKAGNDLNCGKEFAAVENATLSGFIDEAAVDVAVRRLLTRRVQVGDLDRPKSSDPYHNTIPYSVVDSPHSQMVARRVVAESTVILHNGASATTAGKGVLPLKRGAKVQYAVVGECNTPQWCWFADLEVVFESIHVV